MSAYFVLTHTITSPEKYRQEYIPGVMPFLAKHKAEVVVAELEAKPLEGHDFLTDPGYQPVKKIRMGITTKGSAVMAPEFKMPG